MPGTIDLIVTNGRVITMDDDNPRAEAVAVSGNEIVAVGPKAEIEGLKSPATKVVDAAGKTVMPGLIESHVHIFMGAAELENLDLAPVHGLDNLTAAVRGFAAKRAADKLVYANSVSYNVIGDGVYVTRQDLDRVLPDRPFAMMGADHHTVWANTKALELAGILHGGEVPAGAEIVMAPDGTATGELREPGAFRYVLAHTRTGGRDALGFTEAGEPNPAPTAAERASDRAILKRGLDYCAAYGFTSLHNMDGNFYTLELLQEIDDAGEFTIRCQSPFHMKNFFPIAKLESDAVEMRRRFASERVYSGRVKLFMDGVAESWTAMMLEEYPDKPGCFGDPNYTAEQFKEIAIAADRLGLQIDVHAIADAAIRRTLDGFAAAQTANGKRDSRHRIEHVEVIDPADIPRFKELGVIASMQPTHPPGVVFPLWPVISRLRDRQLPFAYPWSTMREVSVAMPFSSDWPVAPIDPMLSFKAAMTRKPFKPGLPDHRQTLMQCIAGYTRDGAFTEFAEARKGRLSRGLLADIVVMSHDLEALDPEALTEASAVTTIADGRITHQA
ncbi:MAG: amidohydrolase [Hyphomicrobiaceae bacterium]